MDIPKVGGKLEETESGVTAIVVRACAEPGLGLKAGGEAVLGKRYVCENCGAEVLVTKAGAASAVCHGAVMTVAQAKPLPSSD